MAAWPAKGGRGWMGGCERIDACLNSRPASLLLVPNAARSVCSELEGTDSAEEQRS